MTTHINRRCKHCLSVYVYQPSGEGCHRPENNHEYCPTCKTAINEALDKIPPKFEKAWVPCDTPHILLPILLEEEKRRKEEVKDEGGIWFKEVVMPLYDMQDFTNNNINGIVHFNGDDYLYSYWTKKDKVEVFIQMQKDLETGELTRWVEYKDRY